MGLIGVGRGKLGLFGMGLRSGLGGVGLEQPGKTSQGELDRASQEQLDWAMHEPLGRSSQGRLDRSSHGRSS